MRLGVVLAAVAAIGLCGAMADAPGDAASGNRQQETQASAPKTADGAAQPKPLTRPASDSEKSANPKKAEPQKAGAGSYLTRVFRWWKGVIFDPDNTSNFFIMLFTAVLTVVAIEQRFLLKRTAAESKDAVEIARQSAAAATSSARTAEESLRISQRAYIVMQDPNLGTAVNTVVRGARGNYLVVVGQVMNAGNTNARDCKVQSQFRVVPLNETPEFEFSFEGIPTVLGRGVGASGITMFIPFDDVIAVHESRSALYVWMRVEYRDVFESTPRFTEILVRYFVGAHPERWLSGAEGLMGLQNVIVSSDAN